MTKTPRNADQRIALWWKFDEDEEDTEHKLPTGTVAWRAKFDIIEHVKEDVECEGAFSQFAHGGDVTIGLADGTTIHGSLDVEYDPRVDFWPKPEPIATESATPTAAGAE